MNESARSLCLITATDLASAMLPEVSTEIIGDGQIAVIAAQYGRGKTPLLTHMALEAACAVPLTPLGLSTCRSPIVVLDGETGPAFYRAMLTDLSQLGPCELVKCFGIS